MPWWALSDLNGRPFGCKPNALTAELSALLKLSYRKPHASSTSSVNGYFSVMSQILDPLQIVHFSPGPRRIASKSPPAMML